MYASSESSVFKDIGKEKVECPRCDGPMEYKTDHPVFCVACGWPGIREEKKSSRKRKRKVNGA